MRNILLILIVFGSIEISAQALATSEDTFLICKSKKLLGNRANDDETNGFIQIKRIADEANPDTTIMIDWVERKKTDTLAGKDIYTMRVSELSGSMYREVYSSSHQGGWLTLNRISLALEIYGPLPDSISTMGYSSEIRNMSCIKVTEDVWDKNIRKIITKLETSNSKIQSDYEDAVQI